MFHSEMGGLFMIPQSQDGTVPSLNRQVVLSSLMLEPGPVLPHCGFSQVVSLTLSLRPEKRKTNRKLWLLCSEGAGAKGRHFARRWSR